MIAVTRVFTVASGRRTFQLMSLGWKVLLPLATLNTLATAVVVVALD